MARSVYPNCPAGWARVSTLVKAVQAPASRADGATDYATDRCAAAKETGRARAVPVGAVNRSRG